MEHFAGRQTSSKEEAAPLLPVRVGDYFCSERDLYCVEELRDGSVVMEDCRTASLVEVPVSELLRLRRVVR